MEIGDGLFKGDPLDLSPSFDIINHNLVNNWEEKLKSRNSSYSKTMSEKEPKMPSACSFMHILAIESVSFISIS